MHGHSLVELTEHDDSAADIIVVVVIVVFFTLTNRASTAPSNMYGHAYSKSINQPGKAGNPVRGQLNREYEYFPVRVRA